MFLLSLLSPAEACSFIGHDPYEVDDSLADDEAPGEEAFAAVSITRGVGPQGRFIQSSTSCDDLGWISVEILPSEPDLGFSAMMIEGEPPDGLTVSGDPFSLLEGDLLQLVWIDGATDDQEAFDFVLGLTPLDRAGNEGPTLQIPLSDQGGGCSSTEARSGLMLALLALFWRRG